MDATLKILKRFLSEEEEEEEEHGSGHDEDGSGLFNVAIATIFAREFLEGAIIIGQYRTVILRNDEWDEETKSRGLATVTRSASFASALAILIVLAVAIPLGVLSKELDDTVVMIIEGVSKVVASICIVQLSVKIPVWLGLYGKVSIFPCKNKPKMDGEGNAIEEAVNTLSFQELRFNVAWNIWREVAECGVFLIPFFLGTGAEAIPISALVGIAIALVLGIGIYFANHKLTDKRILAFFMAALTLFLAVGLFVGGCHEFEEVWGETDKVWVAENPFWSHKQFPMVILKPFGYSSSRTVLQITTFWLFLGLGCAYHFAKWHATQQVRAMSAAANAARGNAPSDDDELNKGAAVLEEGVVVTTNPDSEDTGSDGVGSTKKDDIVEEVNC